MDCDYTKYMRMGRKSLETMIAPIKTESKTKLGQEMENGHVLITLEGDRSYKMLLSRLNGMEIENGNTLINTQREI